MKIMRKIGLIIAIIVTISSFSHAQTLHTIVFCNTIDESIGNSMRYELQNVTNQFRTINGLIDYDEDFVPIDGYKCTRAYLKRVIDRMEVEPDDVILTFYGGHGSHAENNASDPWPQYCMNTGFENQGNWVPMAELAKWVQSKNPRLAVVLSNCCNVVQRFTTIKPLWAMGGDYTSIANVKAERYKKLFSAKGLVMATSSRVPEPSWCCVPDGGLFTCDLITALKMVGEGNIQPDWNSVLKKAYDLCVKRDIVDKNKRHYKQHPYFEIHLGGSVPPPPPVNHERDRRIKNDNLGQALLNIVNKNIDESTRLSMIPNIMSQFMSSFSKVLTVGTDMETVVDNEDPRDFLRRICLSPYIKQVNVISRNNGMLIVHEVRTQ